MKKRLITAVITTLFATSAFGGAALASQDNSGADAVGEPNCHGQRMSYHASDKDDSARRGTPAQRAEANDDYDNAGEINKAVRGFCDAPGT